MNTNDLYLEYARVIEMCKGTEFEDTPYKCIRWRWKNSYKWFYWDSPDLNEFNDNHDVDFAVAVLEGKPVWTGSRIYAKSPNHDMLNGGIVTRTVHGNLVAQFDDGTQIQIYGFENGLETYFTWTPTPPPAPKRTFTLNGVELPCPVDQIPFDDMNNPLQIGHCAFQFENEEDRRKVANMFINLLTEARDK